MGKKLNMTGEQYRDLLATLNEAVYNYAEKQGLDMDNSEELIRFCNTMKKIKLGEETTEILLDGIMNYDVGDQRVLKFIDLEGISFAGRCVCRVDFRGTNADVDPQTVADKALAGANFEGIDMSGKCFDGCIFYDTNLSYTNAKFDPQKIYGRELAETKCDGLDLSDADFTDVLVAEASFKNAKINLNPQKVRSKSLEGTNLENVDMSGKDFSGCNIGYCNLTNTNAVLDLCHLNVELLWGTKLQGTTLLVDENFDRKKLEEQKVVLGEVRLDEYTSTKQKIISTFNALKC